MRLLHSFFAALLLLAVVCFADVQASAADGGILLVQSHLLTQGYLHAPEQLDGQYGQITDDALRRYANDRYFNLASSDSFAVQLYSEVAHDSAAFVQLESKGYSKTQVTDWLAYYRSNRLIANPKWVRVPTSVTTPSSSQSSHIGSGSYSGGGSVHVRGYYRKDGTYVRPHTRSRPRHH
jgi:hypothetical protein